MVEPALAVHKATRGRNDIVSAILSAAINNVMRLRINFLSPILPAYYVSVNLLADYLPAPPSSRSPFSKPATESKDP